MNTASYSPIGRFVRATLRSALLIGSLLAMVNPAIAFARPLDKANCRLDQQGWGDIAGSGLGQQVVLSQTFTPRVHSRICAVRLKLRRNVGHAQTGPLTLTLVTNDKAVEVASTAIPASVIPEGITSEQTFSFGCDGPGLPAAPYYGLQLSSPGSVADAYTWANGDVWRDGDYRHGDRWFSVTDGVASRGAWHPASYAFQVFTCQ